MSQAHIMEKYCDVCGDIGVQEALIACSQCKSSNEHMYCMKILLEEHRDDWLCEDCESGSKPRSAASTLSSELPSQSKLANSVEVNNGATLHAEAKKGLSEDCESGFKPRSAASTLSSELPRLSKLAHSVEVNNNGATLHAEAKKGLSEDCQSGSKPRSAASTLSSELPSLSKLANTVEVNNGATLHAEAKKGLNESRKVSSDWRKKVATGKTKYILAEEAIKLASGAMKSLSNLKVSHHSSFLQPKGGNRSQRSIRPRTEQISFSQQDLYKRASQKLKTQRLGNMEIPQLQHQQSKKLTGGNVCTPEQLRTFDAKNGKENLVSDFERRSWTPALSPSWKGSFRIHDDLKHAELNLHIQGHSPSQVRRKVYGFSKQMPEVLHFELVSCKKIWKIFFQEYFPDRRDIGLYFFPSDRERSDDYILLLETISVENLALRKQFDDVELLVFTSKLLPVDCQRWKGKYFLWGVFHRLKQDSSDCLGNTGAKFSVLPSCNANYGRKQGDEHVEVDMNIDMLGRVKVGKMDVPVQQETLKEERKSFRNDSGGATDFCLKRRGCCDRNSSAKCQKRTLL